MRIHYKDGATRRKYRVLWNGIHLRGVRWADDVTGEVEVLMYDDLGRPYTNDGQEPATTLLRGRVVLVAHDPPPIDVTSYSGKSVRALVDSLRDIQRDGYRMSP